VIELTNTEACVCDGGVLWTVTGPIVYRRPGLPSYAFAVRSAPALAFCPVCVTSWCAAVRAWCTRLCSGEVVSR
jgi:hypothetical protein